MLEELSNISDLQNGQRLQNIDYWTRGITITYSSSLGQRSNSWNHNMRHLWMCFHTSYVVSRLMYKNRLLLLPLFPLNGQFLN